MFSEEDSDEETIQNVGRPTISELIKLLEIAKTKYGDVPVSGAYEGYWNEEVSIQFFEGHLIIGDIS